MEQQEPMTNAQKWLAFAECDLIAARKLAFGEDTLLNHAAFHCQQAAEKAVKADLTFHEIEFPNTHNIEQLINLATKFDPKINSLVHVRKLLTEFATKRYPEPEYHLVKRDEFQALFDNAKGFYNYILTQLLPYLDQD